MITILIPTYNRPGYLKRILGYYSDCRITHTIIVADGSWDEIKKTNKETVSSFPILKVLHLDRYSPETAFNIRLSDALNHVDTKYCVICADDDFITPNGISESTDFLDKNPDFAIAHGRYISFWLERRKNGQHFRWRPVYSDLSITFEHPEQRLAYHLSNYSPTFYAVHRTDVLQMIWAENIRFMNDARFGELLPSMLALIYGKMKCLDVLYAARDHSSIRVGYWPTLGDAIEAGKYDEMYAKFRDCLSTHLSEQSQLNVEESKTLIDHAMNTYMKKYYGYNHKVALLHRAGRVLEHMPRPIDKGVRTLYRALSLPRHNINIPTSGANDDLSKIQLRVLSHGDINETTDASTKHGKGIT